MEFDLQLIISVIGGLGKHVELSPGRHAYIRDDDCIACLKDLQRFLRDDDAQARETFFTLGEFDIAKQHLMPLITTYPDEVDVVFNALKVATWMTMPLEPGSDNPALQQRNMQKVREAVLAGDTLKAIVDLVTTPLAHHPRMSEQDASVVQLVICFVRNLLSVPDERMTDGSSGDHRSRMREELLFRLESDHVLELLLIFANYSNQHPFSKDASLLVEVFTLIFHGVQPAAVLTALHHRPKAKPQKARPQAPRSVPASAAAARPQVQQTTAEAAAAEKLQRERARRMERARAEAFRRAQTCVPRHSRFGATFVQRNSNGLQTGRVSAPAPPGSAGAFVTAFVKAPTSGNAWKLKPLPSQAPRAWNPLRQSLLLMLANYIESFLGVPYDTLMGNLRKDLDAGLGISRLPRTAFVHFMQLATFCFTYVCLKQERFIAMPRERQRAELAAQQENRAPTEASDGNQDPGKASGDQSPFAAVAGSLGWDTFQLLHKTWLDAINTPPSSPEKDWELQHVTTACLRQFLALVDLAADSGTRQDRKASDRLQRRMLHDDLRESGLLPVLAKLVKDFSARKSSRVYAADLVAALHSTMRLLTRLSISEKGGFLVKRRGGGGSGGGGRRKRNPRSSSPTTINGVDANEMNDTTAANDPPADAAADATAEEGANEPAWDRGEESDNGSAHEGNDQVDGRAQRYDPFEEEDREERQRRATREVAYDLKKRLVQEMAYPNVVHFYVWLLSGYQHNEAATNHHVVSFLQRICHPSRGLDMEPMLYQIAILRIFREILDDGNLKHAPAGNEVARFLRGVLRNMFARLVPPLPAEGGDDAEPATANADADKPGDPRDGTEWPNGDAGNDDGESPSGQAAAAAAAREATQLEAKAKQACGQLLFLELLFWKNAKTACEIRDQYNWRDDLGGAGPNGSMAFTPAQDEALRRAWEEVGPGPGAVEAITAHLSAGGHHLSRVAVAARLKALGLKRGALTEAQDKRIKELWEEHGGARGAAASIAADMSLGKSTVSKRLKHFGLKHGVLTDAQAVALRAAHAKNSSGRGALAAIAAEMQWRFTKGQLSKHLRKMGLSIEKGKLNPDNAQPSSASSSSDDSTDDHRSSSSGTESDPPDPQASKSARKKLKQTPPAAKSHVAHHANSWTRSSDTDSSASEQHSPGAAHDEACSAQHAANTAETELQLSHWPLATGQLAVRRSSPPAAQHITAQDHTTTGTATAALQRQHGESASLNAPSGKGSDIDLQPEDADMEVDHTRQTVGSGPVSEQRHNHTDGNLTVRSALQELRDARFRRSTQAAGTNTANVARAISPSDEAAPEVPAVAASAVQASGAEPDGPATSTAVARRKKRLMRKGTPEVMQNVGPADELEDF